MSRDPRWEEQTIGTAVAPGSVLLPDGQVELAAGGTKRRRVATGAAGGNYRHGCR